MPRSEDDQLFRELISVFPADFVTLVVPDLAVQVDLSSVHFRREEYFTDSPRGGSLRRPDLAALVPVLAGDAESVAFHAEIESRYRSARVPRLFDYNRLLSMRNGVVVHTLVLYRRGGSPGVARKELKVKSLGRTVTSFHYDSLGLARASAADYLARPEPLAWAFAAVMRPEAIGSRAELRLACLRRIVAARWLDENQRFLLFNFVATYIESERGTAEEYDELFQRADNREVRRDMMTWAEKIEAKGLERAPGRAAGKACRIS